MLQARNGMAGVLHQTQLGWSAGRDNDHGAGRNKRSCARVGSTPRRGTTSTGSGGHRKSVPPQQRTLSTMNADTRGHENIHRRSQQLQSTGAADTIVSNIAFKIATGRISRDIKGWHRTLISSPSAQYLAIARRKQRFDATDRLRAKLFEPVTSSVPQMQLS